MMASRSSCTFPQKGDSSVDGINSTVRMRGSRFAI
jgi:hypothetical protein